MRITFNSYDKLLPLSELKPSKHQRNKHPKEQIERLAKIMREHGVRHPIHVSTLSGEVCFGHGRWEAAKLNKFTKYPIVYQSFKDDKEEYSCVQSDNAIATWAELDLQSIKLDLPGLGDFDIELLGIRDLELPVTPIEPGCDEDEVPEKVESKAKLGDRWILGDHVLVCGDSTDVCAVDLLMMGEKADMLYADPPYGMNLDTDYSQLVGSQAAKLKHKVIGKKYKAVIGDDQPFDPRPLLEVFGQCDEVFLWGADYYHHRLPEGGTFLIWDKSTDAADSMIGNAYEICWSKQKHKKVLARVFQRGAFGSHPTDDGAKCHPTQKPVKLAVWFFDRWGKDTKIVADPFGGSGSTLIACEKTNRKCFMMEIDPHYIDVIIARWEKYTGKKAELEASGPKEENGKAKETDKRRSGKAAGRNKLQLRRNGSGTGLRSKPLN